MHIVCLPRAIVDTDISEMKLSLLFILLADAKRMLRHRMADRLEELRPYEQAFSEQLMQLQAQLSGVATALNIAPPPAASTQAIAETSEASAKLSLDAFFSPNASAEVERTSSHRESESEITLPPQPQPLQPPSCDSAAGSKRVSEAAISIGAASAADSSDEGADAPTAAAADDLPDNAGTEEAHAAEPGSTAAPTPALSELQASTPALETASIDPQGVDPQRPALTPFASASSADPLQPAKAAACSDSTPGSIQDTYSRFMEAIRGSLHTEALKVGAHVPWRKTLSKQR